MSRVRVSINLCVGSGQGVMEAVSGAVDVMEGVSGCLVLWRDPEQKNSPSLEQLSALAGVSDLCLHSTAQADSLKT